MLLHNGELFRLQTGPQFRQVATAASLLHMLQLLQCRALVLPMPPMPASSADMGISQGQVVNVKVVGEDRVRLLVVGKLNVLLVIAGQRFNLTDNSLQP